MQFIDYQLTKTLTCKTYYIKLQLQLFSVTQHFCADMYHRTYMFANAVLNAFSKPFEEKTAHVRLLYYLYRTFQWINYSANVIDVSAMYTNNVVVGQQMDYWKRRAATTARGVNLG